MTVLLCVFQRTTMSAALTERRSPWRTCSPRRRWTPSSPALLDPNALETLWGNGWPARCVASATEAQSRSFPTTSRRRRVGWMDANLQPTSELHQQHWICRTDQLKEKTKTVPICDYLTSHHTFEAVDLQTNTNICLLQGKTENKKTHFRGCGLQVLRFHKG